MKNYCHIKKKISLSWYLQCTCFINDIWHQRNVHQTSSVFGSHDGRSHPVLVWIQGNFFKATLKKVLIITAKEYEIASITAIVNRGYIVQLIIIMTNIMLQVEMYNL